MRPFGQRISCTGKGNISVIILTFFTRTGRGPEIWVNTTSRKFHGCEEPEKGQNTGSNHKEIPHTQNNKESTVFPGEWYRLYIYCHGIENPFLITPERGDMPMHIVLSEEIHYDLINNNANQKTFLIICRPDTVQMIFRGTGMIITRLTSTGRFFE